MISSGLTRNVLQFFLDNLPEPMFALDVELRYVAFNQAHADVMRTLYGAVVQRGLAFPDVVTAPADAEAMLPNLLRALAGEPLVARFTAGRDLAGRRSYEVAYAPLRDATGAVHGVGVVVRDLTDAQRALEAERSLRQSEELLRQSEEHLRQQQKLESIGTLASGVAHEINNPLNVILNYIELIRDEAAAQGPIRDYADQMTHEAERVATIVRNLLRFARQDVGAQSPARLEDLVDGTLSLIRSSLRKDNILLEVSLGPDLPRVRCRTQQIQQVFMNLLTNARDALNERFPERDPAKRVVVRAAAFERGGASWVRLTVQDWGAGISPEVAPRVFDPFFTTKSRDKGTGLGLSISYGLVREHGGDLWFESRPGEPTSFHLELEAGDDEGAAGSAGFDSEVS